MGKTEYVRELGGGELAKREFWERQSRASKAAVMGDFVKWIFPLATFLCYSKKDVHYFLRVFFGVFVCVT